MSIHEGRVNKIVQNLLGHNFVLHDFVSRSSPVQFCPCGTPAWKVQFLLRDEVPLPHVTVQVVQDVHADHVPSTAKIHQNVITTKLPSVI